MVEVSETPNIERIQDQLAEALNLNLHDVRSLSQRAMMLYTRLKQGKGRGTKGKILIILDNMWHKIDLLEVGIPCESINDFCCKLLVTSRERNVCQMMGIKDDNVFQLGLLNDNESEKLFYHHVGERFLGNYKSIVQRLLSKCGGLSLTIVATANALKGKDLPMWQHFADELEKPISSQIRSVRHETYAILETSYKFIESEEKKMFFLLVCLAPRGSSISIDNLMRYGIGLDLFQHVNKLSEALEQAESWVIELVSSSLLMEGDSKFHVKIHDDVRASAISFAAKDKRIFLVEAIPRWICQETFNKYTLISLLYGGHDFSRLNGVKAEMLQVLLLKGNSSDTSELSGGFFQGMPNLKVLHLSYMNLTPELPESIRELKNLRTLQLEYCKLGKISLICVLKELLVVSLRASYLEELPEEMGKLVNLRMLDMGRCKVSSPANSNVIASLSSLEGLYLFEKFQEWALTATESDDSGGTRKKGNISEFRELPHLSLLEEVHVQEPMHLPVGRFYKNLDRFSIWVGDHVHLWTGFYEIDRRLRGRALELGRTSINNHDALMKDNSCLKALLKRVYCLRLCSTRLENNFVAELDVEGFRDLKYLELDSCSRMEYVISTDGLNYDSIPFQNLEYLILKDLRHLKEICKGEAPQGMFSNLQHLTLYNVGRLEYALPFALLPRNLTKIAIDKCWSLRFIFNKNDCVPSNVVIQLPLLRSIVIEQAKVLVSIFRPASEAELSICPEAEAVLEGQAFFNTQIMCPTLELVSMYMCDKIECLWSKELNMSCFENLIKIKIYYCENMQSLGPASVFSTLMQLRSLSIQHCYRMKDVITEDEIPQKTIVFRQLNELELHVAQKLDSFYGGCYKIEFPKMKKLDVMTLPYATFVVSKDPTALFSDKILCPSLELLELKFCDKIEYFWSKELDMSSFQNLTKIEIVSCEGLQSLGPASVFSALMQLGSLSVEGCNSMKDVISKETNEHEIPEQTIEFRRLRELHLENLNILESFYGGNYKVNFPELKKLTFLKLPKMTTFVGSENSSTLFSHKVEFPCLEELKMISVIKDAHTQLWHWDLSAVEHAPKLRKVTLDSIKALRLIPHMISANISSLHFVDRYDNSTDKVVFSTPEFSSGCANLSQLPKLEEMCVENFQWLENLFENEESEDNGIATFCRQLRKLELQNLPKLKLISLHLFKSLRSLRVSYMRWKYVFPSDIVARGLKLLEDVDISYCKQMDFVIQDEQERGDNDRGVVFPRLKTLKLEELEICSFSSRPDAAMYLPSLVTLELKNCDKMEVLWAGPFVAPELKEVDVWHCRKLRFLFGNPYQVVELLSLERVTVAKADKMDRLCAGPLKAPSLDANSKWKT